MVDAVSSTFQPAMMKFYSVFHRPAIRPVTSESFKVISGPDSQPEVHRTSLKCFLRFGGDDMTEASQWKPVAESRYHHNRVRIANYKGQPFVTGSYSPDHKHTEVLRNGAWEKLPDYAYGTIFFGAGISGWAHTNSETAVYIIGGYEHFGMGQQMHPLAYIAKFENDSWEKLNTKLNHRRYGHSAIWLENELMIIGGFAEPGRTQ